MKTHLLALLGGIGFSLLFFDREIGLNMFLFSFIMTGLYFSQSRPYPTPWPFLGAYIFTGLCTFLFPGPIAAFAHFMSLFVLVGKTLAQTPSLFVSGFLGALNLGTASLLNFSQVEKSNKQNIQKSLTIFIGVLLAILLAGFFTMLYQGANPLFNTLTSQIDLSSQLFHWLIVATLGYLLCLHFLRPYHWSAFVAADHKCSNDLTHPLEPFSAPEEEQLNRISTVGSIVLSTLNLLLLFLLCTDMLFVLDRPQMSHADYSRTVHEGIYTLIFSILCAIGIILFLFKGKLNFYKNNPYLKGLAYAWIALNVLLVFFTAYKNQLYVEALGLTFKRVGVYLYLLLTMAGLLTTYFKVRHLKTLAFMARTNALIWFALLVIAAALPWSRTITWYNLRFMQWPDMEYLLDLDSSNIPLLQRYARLHPEAVNPTQTQRIQQRYQGYKEELQGLHWQEINGYSLLND